MLIRITFNRILYISTNLIMTKDFKIFSQNCDGIRRSKEYVNYFLNVYSCDILCLQETWMLDNTLDFINSIYKDYLLVSPKD